ncbi:MAG TPA: hypothetical protein VNH18_19905 [Bryobacteraceae bacterium]|nr:hypothetical protein [Bryobacteraceae bacterium]HXJ41552.1 hypothetical protein [Bryobacteraceae bacterium]
MTALNVVSATHLADVWRALGGGVLRNGRGRAWWRNGDGWSVSLDNRRGYWYDHRDGIGGGVLDLVAHVQGSTRQDALRWLADLTGVTLDHRSSDRMVARQWAEAERNRRDALYFADAARLMAEETLEGLSPVDLERATYTELIAALRVAPEAEYRAWLEYSPRLAVALVHAGRIRQRRLQTALSRYLLAEVINAA